MYTNANRVILQIARLMFVAALIIGTWPLVATGAHAGEASRFDYGLLWKIETTGVAPSYLFGTIHSDDPRVARLAPAVQQAFTKASSFTMEVIAGGDALVQMAERMFFSDDRTLPAVLGEPLFVRTRAALAERGLPTTDIERKKPWAIVMALSAPRLRTGLFLDLKLQMQATLSGKPTHGLETVAEQLAVFDELPLTDQIALLEGTLAMTRELDQQFEEIIQAYVDRDLHRLMAIASRHTPESAEIQQKVMHRLLAKRNHRMMDRLVPRLREGNAFIAVGAGHLPGPEGLLWLLEGRGYRLSRVY